MTEVPESRRGSRVVAIVLNHETPEAALGAVASLLASRHPLEVVVVDNGSTDAGLHRLAAALPASATLIAAGRNLGFPAGCNLGIREAAARDASEVLLLNSDATVTPETVGRLVDALREHPGAGIAGPAVLDAEPPHPVASLGLRYGPTSGRMRHLGHGARRDEIGGWTHRVQAVAGCAVLITAEALATTGELDEAYFFSFEDLDFCLRAAEAGYATLAVPGAVAFHAGGGTLDGRSPRRLYFASRNHLRLARRFARASPSPPLTALSIVALNVAHALLTAPGPRLAGLAAVARGVGHHLARRYGDPSETGAGAASRGPGVAVVGRRPAPLS